MRLQYIRWSHVPASRGWTGRLCRFLLPGSRGGGRGTGRGFGGLPHWRFDPSSRGFGPRCVELPGSLGLGSAMARASTMPVDGVYLVMAPVSVRDGMLFEMLTGSLASRLAGVVCELIDVADPSVLWLSSRMLMVCCCDACWNMFHSNECWWRWKIYRRQYGKVEI